MLHWHSNDDGLRCTACWSTFALGCPKFMSRSVCDVCCGYRRNSTPQTRDHGNVTLSTMEVDQWPGWKKNTREMPNIVSLITRTPVGARRSVHPAVVAQMVRVSLFTIPQCTTQSPFPKKSCVRNKQPVMVETCASGRKRVLGKVGRKPRPSQAIVQMHDMSTAAGVSSYFITTEIIQKLKNTTFFDTEPIRCVWVPRRFRYGDRCKTIQGALSESPSALKFCLEGRAFR